MEKSAGAPRPTAKDIAADIRREIASGKLGPGDQLRAARELAKEYQVTLVKVQNAYRELSDEGIVFSEVGRGTFVADPSQPVRTGDGGGGTAFVALATEISALHETLRQFGERLEHLEEIVKSRGA